MQAEDMITDPGHIPEYSEIINYIDEPARSWWQEINSFLRELTASDHKIMYSKCSGKPGWNLKYQKKGRAVATLYPEKKGFVVLVVLVFDMIPLIEMAAEDFHPMLMDILRSARPFNGTVWLMLPVESHAMLDSTIDLIKIKMTTAN